MSFRCILNSLFVIIFIITGSLSYAGDWSGYSDCNGGSPSTVDNGTKLFLDTSQWGCGAVNNYQSNVSRSITLSESGETGTGETFVRFDQMGTSYLQDVKNTDPGPPWKIYSSQIDNVACQYVQKGFVAGNVLFFDDFTHQTSNNISYMALYDETGGGGWMQPFHSWDNRIIYYNGKSYLFPFLSYDQMNTHLQLDSAASTRDGATDVCVYDWGTMSYQECYHLITPCSNPVENHKTYSFDIDSSGRFWGVGGSHDTPPNLLMWPNDTEDVTRENMWAANMYILYDNGGQTLGAGDEPSVGDYISDNGSSGGGQVMEVVTSSGTWAGGDAAGKIFLLCGEGNFVEDEKLDNDTMTESSIADVAATGYISIIDDYSTYGQIRVLDNGKVFYWGRLGAQKAKGMRVSTTARLLADPTDWSKDVKLTYYNNDKNYTTSPAFHANGDASFIVCFEEVTANAGTYAQNDIVYGRARHEFNDSWVTYGANNEYRYAENHTVSQIWWDDTELTKETVDTCDGTNLDDNEWCYDGSSYIYIKGAIGDYDPDGNDIQVITVFKGNGNIYSSLPIVHNAGDEDVVYNGNRVMVSTADIDENDEFWATFVLQTVFTLTDWSLVDSNEYCETFDESESDPEAIGWDSTWLVPVTGTDCDGDCGGSGCLDDDEWCYNSTTDKVCFQGASGDYNPEGNTIISSTYWQDNTIKLVHWDTNTLQWDVHTVGSDTDHYNHAVLDINGLNVMSIYGLRSGDIYEYLSAINSGDPTTPWTTTKVYTNPTSSHRSDIVINNIHPNGNNVEIAFTEGKQPTHMIRPYGVPNGTDISWTLVGAEDEVYSGIQTSGTVFSQAMIEREDDFYAVKDLGVGVTPPYKVVARVKVGYYQDEAKAGIALFSDSGTPDYQGWYTHESDASTDGIVAILYANTDASDDDFRYLTFFLRTIDGASTSDSYHVQFLADTWYYMVIDVDASYRASLHMYDDITMEWGNPIHLQTERLDVSALGTLRFLQIGNYADTTIDASGNSMEVSVDWIMVVEAE